MVASLPTQNQMNGIVTITWMQFFPPSIIPLKHMYTCEIYLNHSVSHWNPFNHLSVVLVRFNNNRGMVGFITIFCLWKSVYNQSHSVTATCLSLKSQVSLDKSNGVDAIIYTQTLKYHIPSGKLTVCYGKSPFFMGKSTINGHFQISIAMLVHQRVSIL